MVSVLHAGQPDAGDVALAHEALVRVRHLLADHPGDGRPVEVGVTGERQTFTVPRSAVDLLAYPGLGHHGPPGRAGRCGALPRGADDLVSRVGSDIAVVG